VISIISGDNVALLTGGILAAFGRPEGYSGGHQDPGGTCVHRCASRRADRSRRHGSRSQT